MDRTGFSRVDGRGSQKEEMRAWVGKVVEFRASMVELELVQC